MLPALSKFVAAFLEGRTTSDLEEDSPGVARSLAEGEIDRLREVVGLALAFFLKKGTLTSADAIFRAKLDSEDGNAGRQTWYCQEVTGSDAHK